MLNSNIFDFGGYFTLVLTIENVNIDILLQKIFDDCWKSYITNIIVVVQFENGSKSSIYTYFPFTENHCNFIVPKTLHHYTISNMSALNQLRASDIFPDKMKNLFRCPIAVAEFMFEPYMILEKLQNGTYFTDGIDGNILAILGKKINFTPAIKIVPNNLRGGFIFPNGTMIGSFKMVSNNNI